MATDDKSIGSFERMFAGMNEQITASTIASERFLEDSIHHPDKRLLQTIAVADGAVFGALNAIPDRLLHHGEQILDTAAQAAVMTAAVNMAMRMSPPAMRTALAVAGLGMAGNYIYDRGTRFSADKELTQALDDIWRGSDVASVRRSVSTLERQLGPESCDMALACLAGVGTAHAFGRFDGWLSSVPKIDGFCPVALPSSTLSSRLLADTLSLDDLIAARNNNGKIIRSFFEPNQQVPKFVELTKSIGEISLDAAGKFPLSSALDDVMSRLLKGDKAGAERSLSKIQKLNDLQRGIKNAASDPAGAARHGFVHEQLLIPSRFLTDHHRHLTPAQVMRQTRDMLLQLQHSLIEKPNSQDL